jgi:hypothetical protein
LATPVDPSWDASGHDDVQRLIVVVGGSLTIAALLLPAAGVLVRLISFLVGGRVPTSLSTAMPVAQLVLGGLLAVLPVAGVALTFVFFRRFVGHFERLDATDAALAEADSIRIALELEAADAKEWIHEKQAEFDAVVARLDAATLGDIELIESPEIALLMERSHLLRDEIGEGADRVVKKLEEHKKRFDEQILVVKDHVEGLRRSRLVRAPRWVRFAVLGGSGVFTVAFAIFAPVFPSAVLSLLLSWGASLWLGRAIIQPRRRLRFVDVLPFFVVVLIASALFSGIAPTFGRPVAVSLASGTGLPAGRYVQPARDDQFVYLISCSGPPEVVAVPLADVRNLRMPLDSPIEIPPSLWDITRGSELRLGYQIRC